MRLLPACLAASLLLALALASPALAGGPPGSVEPNDETVPQTHTVRYGKEVVLADLVWLGAMTVVARSDSEGGAASLIGLGYFATGPLIHLRNGNGRGAAKSLVARTVLPAAGMLVGGLLAMDAEDNNQSYEDDELIDDDGFAVLAGAVVGGFVGMVTAVVLDWTTFSKKTVEGRPASWAAAPNVNVNRHGATVGVSGSF